MMLLNCDLGESYNDRRVGDDANVMPYIDQANIACGFHGGDPATMRATLLLAAEHGVSVGAHPSYPDLEGFGRTSMDLSADEITTMLHYQVAALDGMAASLGIDIGHVKPHGALYNDMMAKPALRRSIIAAVASYHKPLRLVLQATAEAAAHREEAAAAGVEVLFEAFADRRYDDDGALLSRQRAEAVHDRQGILAQVAQLKAHGTVTTVSGHTLALAADTLCVHGDNPEAVRTIAEIRALLRDG